VLRDAAQRAGWGQSLPEGGALGVATNQAYNSYVARVVRKDGAVKVEKLTCVADCGIAVSPAGVDEQPYGGLMWGLGHAKSDRIDFRHGRVQQSNFDMYRVMWMSDMPDTDIHIVQGDPEKPCGAGELSSTAVTPAIANAVFRLTRKRLSETSCDVSAAASRDRTYEVWRPRASNPLINFPTSTPDRHRQYVRAQLPIPHTFPVSRGCFPLVGDANFYLR